MALSVGEGSELRSPLALTVMFGLISSTALTLIVIPAVYLVVPSRVGIEAPAASPAPHGLPESAS
jgi:multidrug efflux pump subunit AcrB